MIWPPIPVQLRPLLHGLTEDEKRRVWRAARKRGHGRYYILILLYIPVIAWPIFMLYRADFVGMPRHVWWHYFVPLIALLIPIAALEFSKMKRVALGLQAELFLMNRCPACGYDLRSSPTKCPECGCIPVNPENPEQRQPRRIQANHR